MRKQQPTDDLAVDGGAELAVLLAELGKRGRVELADGSAIEMPGATFRRQLEATRRRAGLTQVGLAERVRERGGKLHSTAITRIEKGERQVSLEEALLLAAALDVSPLYLVFPREDEQVLLTSKPASAAQAYFGEQLRAWMRGDMPLEGLDPSPTFARERPADETVLDRHHAHRLSKMLTATIERDILTEAGFLKSDAVRALTSEQRLDRIEQRLGHLVDEVRLYLDERRRQLDGQR